MKQKRNLNTLNHRRNVLLKYSKIVEIYNRYKESDVPATRILKARIYPIYPISYRTLITILGVPIHRELKEIEEEIERLKGGIVDSCAEEQ